MQQLLSPWPVTPIDSFPSAINFCKAANPRHKSYCLCCPQAVRNELHDTMKSRVEAIKVSMAARLYLAKET